MKPALRAHTTLLALALVLLLLPSLVPGQCYTTFRESGNELVKHGKYDEAIAKFQLAKNCKTDKPDNGDAEMDALIADAQGQKQKTVSNARSSGPTTTQTKTETDRITDDKAWEIARGSENGCRRYLQLFPSGYHAAEARQCVRDYADDDGDGLLNKDDLCPGQEGPASNNGCPTQSENKPDDV